MPIVAFHCSLALFYDKHKHHADAGVQEASYASGGLRNYSLGFRALEGLYPSLEHERGLVIKLLSQLLHPKPSKRRSLRGILSSPLTKALSSM